MKLPEQLSIPSKTGQSRINAFVERYPEPGFIYLACHAAFPVALSSDLLYKIWLNFKQDENGEALDIPLEAVALFANSVLCRSIGNGLFEIYEDVKGPLQDLLQSHDAFGPARMQHLAQFILAYTDHCTDKMPSPAFKKALRWKAEAYLDPKKAALELIALFAEKAEKGEDTRAVKVFLSWAKGHRGTQQGEGINYIGLAEDFFEGVRQFQAGNRKAAEEVLKRIAPFIQQEEDSENQTPFKTRLPEGFLALMDATSPVTEEEAVESDPVKLFANDHARNREIISTLNGQRLNSIEWITYESDADYVIHFGQQFFYLALPGQSYQPLHCPLPLEQVEEALEVVQNVEQLKRLRGRHEPDSVANVYIQVLRNERWENLEPHNGIILLDGEDTFVSGANTFRVAIEGVNWRPDDCAVLYGWVNFSVRRTTAIEGLREAMHKDNTVFFPLGEAGMDLLFSDRTIDYNLAYDEYPLTVILGGPELRELNLDFPGLPPVIDFGNLQEPAKLEPFSLPKLEYESYNINHFILRLKNPYYNLPDPEGLKKLLANRLAEPFMRAIYFESNTLHPQYQLKSEFKWDYRSPTQKIAADLQNLIEGDVYKPFVEDFEGRVKNRLVPGEPLVIGLGDSWYNQAEPIDIVSHLTKRFTTVKAFANTSSAENFLLRDIEPEIQRHTDAPVIVLLSPWGKELTHDIDDFINETTPDDGIRTIMNEPYWAFLEALKAERKARLEALTDWKYEHLHFIIHGRDYFHAAAPEDSNKAKALTYLVDHINEALKKEVAALGFPNLHFLDLRRTLKAEDWAYDFVPNEHGFKKLAEKFQRFIDQGFTPLEERAGYKGSAYYMAQHVEVEVEREPAMKRLMDMVGRASVKQQIYEYVRELKAGENPPENSLHMVFTGNPGTGKTTVARLLADIYKEENILKRGHLVEVSKSDLISQYVGQTAERVKQQCEKALDGVLLIDEAGFLTRKNETNFIQEAIDSLLNFMEDYGERIAVFLAGYPDEMKAFLSSNPGIGRRVGAVIHFGDYAPEEFYEIFLLEASKNNFRYSPAFDVAIREVISNIYKNRGENFGNASEVKRLFNEVVEYYTKRRSTEMLSTAENLLEANDIPPKYKTEPEQEQEVSDFLGNIGRAIEANETDALINTLNRHTQIAAYEKATEAFQLIQVTAFVIMGNEGEGHSGLVNRIYQINREERGLTDLAGYTLKLSPAKNWSSFLINCWQSIYEAVGLDSIRDVNNPASLLRRVIKSGATHKILAFQLNMSEWPNALLDRFFIYVNEVFRLRKRGKNREKERLQCFFLLEYEVGYSTGKLTQTLQKNFSSRSILPELQSVSIADIEAWLKENLNQGRYSKLEGKMRLEGVMARYFSDGEAWPMEEAQYRLRQIMDNLTPEGDDPEQSYTQRDFYEDETVEQESYPEEQSAEEEEVPVEVTRQIAVIQDQVNELINTNQFAEAVAFLKQRLKKESDRFGQVDIFRKEYEDIVNRRGKYRRAIRNTDELVSNLAEALLVLVEQLQADDLKGEASLEDFQQDVQGKEEEVPDEKEQSRIEDELYTDAGTNQFSIKQGFKSLGNLKTLMLPIFPYNEEKPLKIENVIFDYYPDKIFDKNDFPFFYEEVEKYLKERKIGYIMMPGLSLIDYLTTFSEVEQEYFIEFELGICGYIDFLWP